MRSLLELAALTAEVYHAIPRVTVPVLVVTSALDGVVDPSSGDLLAERLAGRVKRLLLPRSRHVACVDLDRNLLVTTVVGWLGRWA